jgi:hypothetical protein
MTQTSSLEEPLICTLHFQGPFTVFVQPYLQREKNQDGPAWLEVTDAHVADVISI